MICLDLKPPYSAEVTTKLYPVGFVTPKFQNFEIIQISWELTQTIWICV